MKEACSVKLQAKLLFLLKIKIKQNPGCISNIMQSSSTFIRIAGTFTEVKKSAVINDCGNISYWEERAKQSIREQVLFVPNTVGCLGGVTTIGKVCNFYPH